MAGVPRAPEPAPVGDDRGARLASCASPRLAGRSAYAVLGFTGFGVGTVTGAAVAALLGLSLAERLIGVLAGPVAFLVVHRVAKRLVGRERLVFYENALAGAVIAGLAALAIGGRVASLLDCYAIGIGTFHAVARLGCFRAACCHGRPTRSRFAVRYGRAHVLGGFPRVWGDRPIVPLQLVESAACAALVSASLALALRGAPGDAAALYAIGYAVARFLLEIARGDPSRAYRFGLSEAQRAGAISSIAAAALAPHAWTIAGAALVAGLAIWRAAIAKRPAAVLLAAAHVHELATLQERLAPAATGTTSAGLGVSRHALPDGRTDYVWSRAAGLPLPIAVRLADELHAGAEVFGGRAPNLVHVVVNSG